MRIVITDDQKRARQGLKALLSASLPGSGIWEAANGAEALQLAEDLHRRPVRDGHPHARGRQPHHPPRAIKSRWPEIKVLVLSLYPGRQAEALAAGADLFVGKGESPERLLCAISSLL